MFFYVFYEQSEVFSGHSPMFLSQNYTLVPDTFGYFSPFTQHHTLVTSAGDHNSSYTSGCFHLVFYMRWSLYHTRCIASLGIGLQNDGCTISSRILCSNGVRRAPSCVMTYRAL